MSLNKLLSLLLILAALSCGGTTDSTNSTTPSTTPNTNDSSTPTAENSQSCGTETILFTHAPTEPISSIVPLGNINASGGHTFPSPHLYIYFEPHQEDSDPPPTKVNILAPGDITITHIDQMNYLTSKKTDFSVDFKICSKVTGYFKHMKGLSEELMTAMGSFSSDQCTNYSTGGEDMQRCNKSVAINISAGTVIGHAGGDNETQYNFDWGLRDTRIERLDFINQSAFYDDWYYIVCALDYYDDPLKTQLKNKLGYDDGSGLKARTIEPICGENAQDIPNTLKGNWLKNGITSVQQEDPHVSFVDFNLNPEKKVVSIGKESGVDTSETPKAIQFTYTPTSNGVINRDPKNISPGETVYCFEHEYNNESDGEDQYKILLQLTSSANVSISKQSGECVAPFSLGENSATFNR